MMGTDRWHDNRATVSTLSQREIAQALGGDAYGRDGVLAPGPGHSRRDRSLRIWIDQSAPQGFRVHSFADDDPLLCRYFVSDKLGLERWRTNSPGIPKGRPPVTTTDRLTVDTSIRQREKARWLWSESQPAPATRVEEYLRARSIVLGHLPTTIRYLAPKPPKHPHPAMVAAFATPSEPEPGRLQVSRHWLVGVHLTRLRTDGKGKAGTDRDKIMLGPSLGTPIVLAAVNDNLGLTITEGIEDALSVHLATGLGAWAAGSATRLPALADAVPNYVEEVTIIADGDDAGQRNALLLADRLEQRRFAVTLKVFRDEVGLAA